MLKFKFLFIALLFMAITICASDSVLLNLPKYAISLENNFYNEPRISLDVLDKGLPKYSIGVSIKKDLFFYRILNFRKDKTIMPSVTFGLSFHLPYRYKRTEVASYGTFHMDTIGIYEFYQNTNSFRIHLAPGLSYALSKKLLINVSSNWWLEPYYTTRTNFVLLRGSPFDIQKKYYGMDGKSYIVSIKLSYMFKY